MRGGIAVRSAQVAILALCLAAAALIFLIALDTTPIADDYGDLPSILHSGVFQYLHSYWVGATDRYSDAVFMLVLVRLFGVAAIHVATPFLIALLVCFCVAAARVVSPTGKRGLDASVVGCLAAITVAVSTPSIFDTLGWFNAVAIYLAGIVAAVGTAAWMAHLAIRRSAVTSWHVIASFVVGLVAAGFTELVGMVIALGSLLVLVNVRDILPRGPRRRSLVIAQLAITAGATIGVLVIFVGPGSRSRFHGQHGGQGLSVIIRTLRTTLGWANTDIGWRTLVSVAVGLAAVALAGAPKSRRAARWITTWAVFLCCVPMLVVVVASGYSNIEFVQLRAIAVATIGIAVGEAVIVYLISAALVNARPGLVVAIRPTAAVLAAVGLLGFGTAALPVIRAELLRRTAVTARAVSIHRQLLQHRTAISVMPVPLIDFYSNAYDLLFGHKRQLNYVLAGIREYYEISHGVEIRVIAQQPRHYCLPHLSVPAYAVNSCAEFKSKRSARDPQRQALA